MLGSTHYELEGSSSKESPPGCYMMRKVKFDFKPPESSPFITGTVLVEYIVHEFKLIRINRVKAMYISKKPNYTPTTRSLAINIPLSSLRREIELLTGKSLEF